MSSEVNSPDIPHKRRKGRVSAQFLPFFRKHGPEDGDAAKVLNETGAGTTVSFGDKEKMKDTIKALYNRYLEGNLTNDANPAVEQYSRRVLAGEYVKLLQQL